MDSAHDLRQRLAAFETSTDGIEYGLRLDLADLVIRQLNARGWTQQQLADAVGVKASVISRVVHAQQRLTLKSLCKLLAGLGVQTRLLEFEHATESIVLIDGTRVSLTTGGTPCH